MFGINKKLACLKEPIKVGLVGAGYMGSGVFNVISQMQGMEIRALYDESIELARRVVSEYPAPGGKARVAETIEDLCRLPEIEIIVDTTCSPCAGARAGVEAVRQGKSLVSINIEADVTVGVALKKMFAEAGLIYTVTAGDEPGDLKKLYDHYSALNFRVVAAGKGKNNPLNVEATPDTVSPGLPDNGITAQQVASFVDGSKTMFEMACLSNATGLVPDIRGMHGPEARIDELTGIYRSKKEGGILEREGVVDYITGRELSGGIFIVVATDNKRIRSDFAYLKVGAGPYYVFYQRYHNWFIDMPLSIARAVIDKEPTVYPLDVPTSQVVAVAKKDLKKGEVLDGIGGYSVYGSIEKYRRAREENFLPHGLTEGAVISADIPQGKTLTYDEVILDKNYICSSGIFERV